LALSGTLSSVAQAPDRADCEWRLPAFDAQGRLSPHAKREAASESREFNRRSLALIKGDGVTVPDT
jgi:hypothetical protein